MLGMAQLHMNGRDSLCTARNAILRGIYFHHGMHCICTPTFLPLLLCIHSGAGRDTSSRQMSSISLLLALHSSLSLAYSKFGPTYTKGKSLDRHQTRIIPFSSYLIWFCTWQSGPFLCIGTWWSFCVLSSSSSSSSSFIIFYYKWVCLHLIFSITATSFLPASEVALLDRIYRYFLSLKCLEVWFTYSWLICMLGPNTWILENVSIIH